MRIALIDQLNHLGIFRGRQNGVKSLFLHECRSGCKESRIQNPRIRGHNTYFIDGIVVLRKHGGRSTHLAGAAFL